MSEEKKNYEAVDDIVERLGKSAKKIVLNGKKLAGKAIDGFERLPKAARKTVAIASYVAAGAALTNVSSSSQEGRMDNGHWGEAISINGLAAPLLFLGVGIMADTTKEERKTLILKAKDFCKE